MNSLSVSRRVFVASAVTIAALEPQEPAQAMSPKMLSQPEIAKIRRLSAPVPFRFDLDKFNTILGQPYPHRQVAVATTFQGATDALSHMRRSIQFYSDPLGFAAGPNSLHVAAVLYGGYSYAVSLDDAMYEKYPIALLVDRELHPGDSTYSAAAKSLRHNPSAADYRALVADHGAAFFVCNNALSGFALEVARAASLGVAVTRDRVVEVHDDLVQHLIPGTMLVPVGVAALNAAQEAHFTFLPE